MVNTTEQTVTFEVDFENKMTQILSALGIQEPSHQSIITGLKDYAKQDKIKIIETINTQLPKLLEADTALNKLFNEVLKPYKIEENWNAMIKQLAELQGLIILKKVHYYLNKQENIGIMQMINIGKNYKQKKIKYLHQYHVWVDKNHIIQILKKK
jgi:hypothetical protein